MLPTPCHIVGDAHIGVAPPDAERALLDYLRAIPGRARSLVIMGDLFDFWFAWRHVMPRTGFRVLAALADLRERDIEMLWLAGNHDCWGGETLSELSGATYTLDAWTGSIGAWRVHLAHGDGLREREDAQYRRIRAVFRNPLAIRAYSLLHPNSATAIAQRSSSTSRHRQASDEGRGLLEVATAQLADDDSLDLVVHGHSHMPLLTRVGRRTQWYANAGAWYIDRQFLRLDDSTIERRVWTGSGEGDQLDIGYRVSEEAASKGKESVGRI